MRDDKNIAIQVALTTLFFLVFVGLLCAVAWWNPLGWKESRLTSFLVSEPYWDGCEVRYTVLDEYKPVGGDDVIRQALSDLSTITGLVFVEDSLAGEGNDGVVVFSWYPSEYGFVEYLGTTHNTLKEGSVVASEVSLAGAGSVLEQDPHMLSFTVWHEVGHVLGLEHTPDTTSFMYPLYDGSQGRMLTEADIAQLRYQASLGCPTVR